MAKKLVAYFSASGVTAKVAKNLAAAIEADAFEIAPVEKYTDADLDWRNPGSRSSVEMKDKPDFRPPIANKVGDMSQYGTIFLGFPIWWYTAPTIIKTFLESYDLKGKKIIPFATSGGSGLGNINAAFEHSCPGADILVGKRFSANATKEELKVWAEKF